MNKTRNEKKCARVAFIGVGAFISTHHLLTVRDCPYTEIAAIADLDKSRLQSHAAKMSVGYITSDYHKILDDPAIDIVIIGTKQNLHAKMIVECLNVGKWVLCEKPMAETIDETKMVLAAEKQSTGRLAIGFNRRFAPAYQETLRLMQNVKKPWYINYRLMFPSPQKNATNSFYSKHERILYEGCHILDLISWMFGSGPERVFMSGDRFLNNTCILEYPEGSRVSLICGSMGSYAHWKEYMEIFGSYTSITVSDFIDMRVRGFKGEYDRLYGAYRQEHNDDLFTYGFDFYESYKMKKILEQEDEWKPFGMVLEDVRRPTPYQFDPKTFTDLNPDSWNFVGDKGWEGSVQHFARSFLDGTVPRNADGAAGALSTQIALTLLKSLETGLPQCVVGQ